MFRRRPNHSAQYKAHLRSPEWRRICKAALERACYRCQLCGLPLKRLRLIGRHLEVHHNNYENLGCEQPEDLVVLCAGRGGCHTVADAQRRAANGRRRAKRRTRGNRFVRRLKRSVITFGLMFCLVSAAPYILPLIEKAT
ncbi:MAG TPA: hypothetical protein VE645_18935 [Pseudonocardiaceae bacterium]|jgi:hypothetical protein|nr:hypothetical protein [Pseudonocardiaceae bacterium]